MPIKRTYRKKKPMYRRRYRRRYGRKIPRNLPLTGFPESQIVKLRYIDPIRISDAFAINYYPFRANGPQDPYALTGGHQPNGYDQWAQIYTKYTVLSAKCTMRFIPTSTSNPATTAYGGSYWGVLLATEQAATDNYTDVYQLMESKRNPKYKLASVVQGSTYNKDSTISKSFDATRFFGVKDLEDGSAYSSEVSTVPDQQAFFIPWQGGVNTAVTGFTQEYIVTIDYVIKFHDPKTLASS